jgi:outer membrane protein assembly factor BamB
MMKKMMRKNRLTTAAAGIAMLVDAASIFAQDWPQWRGPGRDGKVSKFVPPQSWPKELTLKWKVTVGLGDSSPALVGDKLYAFGRQGADEVIRCLDASSGKVLWQDIYPAGFIATGPSARHPGPRSSPVVSDGKLCVLGIGGILTCLDAATGKVLWRKQSAADYLDTPYHFESSMSPLVIDGMCIVYVGGEDQGAIIAFDLADGKAKWKYSGDAPSPSSPVIATVGGVRQIVTITEKNVIGVSLADRSLLWHVPFKAKPVNATTPVVTGQTVIVTGQEMGTQGFRISEQGGKFTAEQVWTTGKAQAGSTFTTPVLRDGMLFGYANARLNCLSVETGKELWGDSVPRGRSAAIIEAGPCLMALTLNGELSVYQPSGTQYTELARYKVGDPEIWAHPVVAGKNIFIRDKDSVALWTME